MTYAWFLTLYNWDWPWFWHQRSLPAAQRQPSMPCGDSLPPDIRQSKASDKKRNGKFWTSTRKARLLEWVEKNPIESRIIYTKRIDWNRRRHTQQKKTRKTSWSRNRSVWRVRRRSSLPLTGTCSFESNWEIIAPFSASGFGISFSGHFLPHEKLLWVSHRPHWPFGQTPVGRKRIQAINPTPKLDEIQEGTQTYKDLGKLS